MASVIEVLKVLETGATIHHALVSSTWAVFDGENKKVDIKFDIQTFLSLLYDELIEVASTMRRGHPIFLGSVCIYKISEKGKTLCKEG